MKSLLTLTLTFFALSQIGAAACTLKNAQDNFSTLNGIFQSYTSEIAAYRKRGEQIPADLMAKRTLLLDGTKTIRKLFSKEVAKKPSMQSSDQVDPVICEHFSDVSKGHAVVIQKIALEAKRKKAETPVCKLATIRKRFGAATRQQRALTNAGKVNKQEQIIYREIATSFNKNLEDDFQQACKDLHEYEKSLKAKKVKKTKKSENPSQ